YYCFFFFQAEDGIRDFHVTGVQTCALPIFDPFPREAFDLVSAQYASLPRTPDQRAVHSLLDAVAPGGAVVVVSHDLAPMRAPIRSEERRVGKECRTRWGTIHLY